MTDHELEQELLRDLESADQEKAELIKKIKNLSDDELNDFKRFWNYVEICLGSSSLQPCGDLIQFASKELRRNRELVMKAVSYPNIEVANGISLPVGSPLEYASGELQNDRELVHWAVWNSPDAYRFASDEIKMDATVYLSALRKALGDAMDTTHIPEQLFEDSTRFYEFLKPLGSGEILTVLEDYTAPEGCDEDRIYWHDDIVGDSTFIGSCETTLDALGERIRCLFADKDLLLRALAETDWARHYIPKEHSKDREVKKTLKENPYIPVVYDP